MSGALFPGMLKNCPSIGQFGRSRAEGSAAGGVKSANLLRGRGAGRDPPLKNSQDGSIYGHVLSLRLSWSGGSRLDSSYDEVGGFAPPIGSGTRKRRECAIFVVVLAELPMDLTCIHIVTLAPRL